MRQFRLTSTDGPLPGSDDATYNRYDVHGRRTWQIGPAGADGTRTATRTDYRKSDDKVLTVWSGTLPDAQSSALAVASRSDTRYDARRNPTLEFVSEDNGTTRTVVGRRFDARNRLVCEARRMNQGNFGSLPDNACALAEEPTPGSNGPDRITHNEYDDAGQLLRVRRAYRTPLEQIYAAYEYDGNGSRTSVTDAEGNRAELRYDGYGRQVRWVFPSPAAPGQPGHGDVNEGDFEAYRYDDAGNRIELRKRDGTTIGYEYDGRNRMTRKTVPQSASGAPEYSVFYGYDVDGLQLYARFGSASGPGVTNTYDGFGRLSTTTTNMDGTARTLASQYDAGSRRSVLWDMGVSYSGGYSYDPAGRLTRYDEGMNALAFRPGYDALGRRTSIAFGVGNTVSAVSYGYDPIGRLATLGHDLAGPASDQSLGFTYNPASQIAARTSANDSYRSTSALDVNRSYSTNGLNQYTQALPAGSPTVSFGYDLNGNLMSDGSNSYVYDAENRLVSAGGSGGTVALSYDPLGRLWQVSGPSGTTRFLYDGDDLIQERDGNGTLLRAYVHGPGADEPLMWYEYTSGFSRRFLHADHQGSIVAASDSGGNAIAIAGYDAWGIPNQGTVGVQAGGVGRFGYTGQVWIPELGLYYYKARIYSPTLGRFLQTDPVGYRGGNNLYAYVGNDPINQTDSTGLATDEEIRRARQTLNALKSAIRRDIRASQETNGGTRIRAASDTARIQALRTQLRQLDRLNPRTIADMRVNAPTSEVGSGLANAMRGAQAETIYTASGSDGSVSYETAAQTSQTSDSAHGSTNASNLRALGHPHGQGAGREYPGVADPGNVLIQRVPNVYTMGENANAIGWNGSRFTLSNVEGRMPGYSSAPEWVRETFEPW